MIGETSPIWLTCSLDIYCPTRFLLIDQDFHSRQKEIIQRSKREFLNKRNRRYLGKFTYKFKLNSVIETYPRAYIIQMERSERLSPFRLVPFNRLESAKKIHDSFIHQYSLFHQKWIEYARWKEILNPLNKDGHRKLVNFFLYPSFAVNTICLFTCTVLLKDISPFESLTASQKYGFLCLFVFFILYILCYLVGMAKMAVREIYRDPKELTLSFPWIIFFPDIIMFTFLMGTAFTIRFVYLKLSNITETESSWFVTTTPLCIAFLVMMMELLVTCKYRFHDSPPVTFGAFVVFGISCLVTLAPFLIMANNYDQGTVNDWKHLSMFYYPHFVGLLVTTGIMLWENGKLWTEVIQHDLRWAEGIESNAVQSSMSRYLRRRRWGLLWYSIGTFSIFIALSLFLLLLLAPWKLFPDPIILTQLHPFGLTLFCLSFFHLSIVSLLVLEVDR
jgi:hypothetical protein